MSVWDRERDVKKEKKNHTCNSALSEDQII